MKKLNDLELLKLNKFKTFWYKVLLFFCSIPSWFANLGVKIWGGIKSIGLWIKNQVFDIGYTFAKGNWAVRLSFLIFGFGNFYYGQWLRGILFLLFEAVFIIYMALPTGGAYWISKCHWFFGKIGDSPIKEVYDPVLDTWGEDPGYIDSVRILLYGILSVIFVIAFIYTWRTQIKQCRICMDITAKGKKVRSGKKDLQSLLDYHFHKTLLSLPLLGILAFTVLPIIFMILIAFTNYDATFNGRKNLIEWVGWDNFNQILNFGEGGLGLTFGEILAWTLMWAFFATFTNYFLGMLVAIMINKRGIVIKKFWRTVLVMTIAIPQFVSLLYVSNLFDASGFIGNLLEPAVRYFTGYNSLWESPVASKILIIVINIWIGIPYVMLMATGILMNIPKDLYESSKIDGANSYQQFMKITLPYMLFVTGPYLLTSFVGNLNNFNVIYLLTEGGPTKGLAGAGDMAGSIGHTDLLITWLFKITTTDNKFYLASVVGILVFLVVAILSLIIYNVIPSNKNEEDYK